jgi:hypothetical protein
MKIRINWGLGIALVYAAFAAGTLSVVILASTRHVDLVSEDYYQRSLSVDRQIAADERGRAAGVIIAIDEAGGGPRLDVAFPAGATAVTRGTVALYRASGSANDRVYPLKLDDTGRQSIDLSGVATGHWQVQLRWIAADQEYYIEHGVVTP